MTDIIRNPKTIKDLAEEIKRVCDSYWAREISEDVAKEYVIFWSKHEAGKLFKGKDINSTITHIIGKNRIELVTQWLEGTQMNFK